MGITFCARSPFLNRAKGECFQAAQHVNPVWGLLRATQANAQPNMELALETFICSPPEAPSQVKVPKVHTTIRFSAEVPFFRNTANLENNEVLSFSETADA